MTLRTWCMKHTCQHRALHCRKPTTDALLAQLVILNPSLMQCAPLLRKHFKSLYNLAPFCRMNKSLRKLKVCRRSSPAARFIWTSFKHPQFCHCSVAPRFHCYKIVPCCFAVALNFQSLGLPMDLNDGRFQDNGGCGYVLKPAVLMSSQRSFDPGCSQHSLKPTHLLLKVQLWSTERWIIHTGWIYGLRCNVTWLCVFFTCMYVCAYASQSSDCVAEPILLFASRQMLSCRMLWTNNDVILPASVSV